MVTHRGFFPPVLCLFYPFSSDSASPAPHGCSALLSLCSACISPCHSSFLPHLPPFFFAFYRAKAENAFSTSSACFSKEIHLWSKGCSLGAAALCFGLVLFLSVLSYSLVFLFPEYPLNTSPLPATGSSVLLPGTSGTPGSFVFACFSFLYASRSLLVGNGQVGKIAPSSCSVLTCWRRHLSLPQWSEIIAGLGLFPLGFIPSFLSFFLSFSLIRTTLCWLNQEQIRWQRSRLPWAKPRRFLAGFLKEKPAPR